MPSTRTRDKGSTVIFSPGKKNISLSEKVALKEAVSSDPFVFKKISSSYSNADDKLSGDVYEGYIVLVTKDGEILAKASNSSRYLKDEWLKRCK